MRGLNGSIQKRPDPDLAPGERPATTEVIRDHTGGRFRLQ